MYFLTLLQFDYPVISQNKWRFKPPSQITKPVGNGIQKSAKFKQGDLLLSVNGTQYGRFQADGRCKWVSSKGDFGDPTFLFAVGDTALAAIGNVTFGGSQGSKHRWASCLENYRLIAHDRIGRVLWNRPLYLTGWPIANINDEKSLSLVPVDAYNLIVNGRNCDWRLVYHNILSRELDPLTYVLSTQDAESIVGLVRRGVHVNLLYSPTPRLVVGQKFFILRKSAIL